MTYNIYIYMCVCVCGVCVYIYTYIMTMHKIKTHAGLSDKRTGENVLSYYYLHGFSGSKTSFLSSTALLVLQFSRKL